MYLKEEVICHKDFYLDRQCDALCTGLDRETVASMLKMKHKSAADDRENFVITSKQGRSDIVSFPCSFSNNSDIL